MLAYISLQLQSAQRVWEAPAPGGQKAQESSDGEEER